MTGGVGGEQGSDEMPETDAGHRPQREERVRTHLRSRCRCRWCVVARASDPATSGA